MEEAKEPMVTIPLEEYYRLRRMSEMCESLQYQIESFRKDTFLEQRVHDIDQNFCDLVEKLGKKGVI